MKGRVLQVTQQLGKTVAEPVKNSEKLDFHALNALLNLYDEDCKIQFDKYRESANQYFLQHVNQNTVYFHDLEEKIEYLVENKYYEPEVIEAYDWEFIKSLPPHQYYRAYMRCSGHNQLEIKWGKIVEYSNQS